jgi:hypothetical protein
MSDEELPPTHQEWGSRQPDPTPDPYAPPPNPYAPSPDPYAPPPNPYPQPGTFDQFAAPNPYGAPAPGYGYPGYPGAVLPDHPSSTTAMVLGLISLIGVVFCGGVTLVLAPFAWVTGSRTVRAIDAEPGRYGGREKAQAGKIMGIIGTVLLVLGVIALIGVIGLIAVVGNSSSDPSPSLQSGFANS